MKITANKGHRVYQIEQASLKDYTLQYDVIGGMNNVEYATKQKDLISAIVFFEWKFESAKIENTKIITQSGRVIKMNWK